MLTETELFTLRDRFVAVDYTVAGVVAAIGEQAHAALGRNSTLPAVAALTGRDDPLATVILLWPLQREVPRSWLDRALPGLLDALVGAGVVTLEGDDVRALVDIRPYAADDEPMWIVSDLTPGLDTVLRPIRPDFVLGVSSASSTLAQLIPRRPARTALDLGTGCGVQALHLARHVGSVVGTDVNPRALELARATLTLNSVTADLRAGSLYEPVAGERYDLVVSNPPYVMAPPSTDGARLTYREGSHRGDGLVEHLVRGADQVLAEDGTLVLLANWAHVRGADWVDRLGSWLDPTGCDAHVVQREVMDTYAYVELWLADAGLTGRPDYAERYLGWVAYLDRLGIEAVGMGWLVLHRAGREQPWRRIEDWPHPVEQPIAPALEAERLAVARLDGATDAELLATRWTLAGDVVEERTGRPGAADPEHIVLRGQRGFRRAVAVDTALAGVLGACDGDLPLGVLIDTVAGLLDVDAVALTEELLPRIRSLVVDQLLS